jgi:uncharacterized membrane protein
MADPLGREHVTMGVILNTSSASPETARDAPRESDLDQNIDAVLEFYAREERKLSRSQRFLEYLNQFIGQPIFVGVTVFCAALWVFANFALRHFGRAEIDPAPFHLLQGVVGFGALLIASVVLIKQNRFAKLDEQRAHLDLKVTLLIEKRAAKLIDLLEELRRDLPNVKNRHDAAATVLQEAMNPDLVLAALDERNKSDPRSDDR